MNRSSAAAPTRRLSFALLGYSFADDCVLLYPLYTLLFADTGLSVAQISSLLVIWAATGLVLEVPSGAWADTVSRRLLLMLGPLLAGTGYALWVAVPSYWAFAVGFVLWGAHGALQSGATEALVYEELERLGATDRYATLMGRAEAAGTVAVVVAIAVASPVFAAGGYHVVGVASVLACLVAVGCAAALPEHRTRRRRAGTTSEPDVVSRPAESIGAGRPDEIAAPAIGTPGTAGLTGQVGTAFDRHPAGATTPAGGGRGDVAPGGTRPHGSGPDGSEAESNGPDGYLATLRAGFAEVRAVPTVRHALLLVPAVAVVWGDLEEYVPLLARESGATTTQIPLWMLLIWIGVTAGGLLAGAGGRLPVRRFAALIAAGAALLAAGAVVGHPAGLLLVALAFGAFQLATVVADARLQAAITGPSRATVTSLSGLATSVVSIVVYLVYGTLAEFAGHGITFLLFAVPYLATAAILAYGGRRQTTSMGVR